MGSAFKQWKIFHSFMYSVTRLLNEWLIQWMVFHSFIHACIHWGSQAGTWLRCQYSGHHDALQSQPCLNQRSLLQRQCHLVINGRHSCASIDSFPYLLWFGWWIFLIVVQSSRVPVAKTMDLSPTALISWWSPHSCFSLLSQWVMRCR